MQSQFWKKHYMMDQRSKQIEKIQEILNTINFILKERDDLDKILEAKLEYIKQILRTL